MPFKLPFQIPFNNPLEIPFKFTFSFESELTDSGVTNSLALLVKIVLTLAPFFFKDLIISKLLYAEIPPHITKSIFFYNKILINLEF